MKPVKKTLLDTEPEPSDAERVDAFLEGLKEKRRRLRAELVDEAAADEAFRRELLEVLQILGEGKRGRVAPSARLDYVKALCEAGFTKKEVVELIRRLYGGSERQAERDFEKQKAPAKH
ncbi:hypothetical protein [Polaromonas sp. JS666]|uniref:hypothetical protein n=1 Tax=Polaromonas sp. (strain JS666 / ATCC BAA-500) TaxID=296591 RepID=UPI0000464965|nr:hypothetical protein [Polaromonas sp. JS666]ABE43267.1 hypothetical protein Bpro_1317 [Polaromonas sp. JS666]